MNLIYIGPILNGNTIVVNDTIGPLDKPEITNTFLLLKNLPIKRCVHMVDFKRVYNSELLPGTEFPPVTIKRIGILFSA